DSFIADHASRTWSVLDDDGLSEPLLHRLPEDATYDVGAPAGTERDDDADRSLRPFLSGRRCRNSRGARKAGDSNPNRLVHAVSSRGAVAIPALEIAGSPRDAQTATSAPLRSADRYATYPAETVLGAAAAYLAYVRTENL